MLARTFPDPLPAIRPVPEYLAGGERKQWYEEMKLALQVPWMGVVTMAYAHYPTFFGTLWRGLEPLVASRPFVREFQALRAAVETEVARLSPAPIVERLAQAGYAGREIEQIRAMVEVFSHGNFPYLLIATLVRLLLEGEDMNGAGEAPRFEARHGPDVQVPFVLMEYHHADAPTRALYDDVKSTLGLPFVNTDYRAFARWPSYFALAWGDLKTVVTGKEHAALCQGVHERAVKSVAAVLPNPGGLTSSALRAAAQNDATLDEVLQVARLFQWLLPGLVTNVAFFRAQLRM